mmetsp:Transcript_5957/g.12475  ORF Transcript_5957/g.12475 Transcript_5957/m.12475 type:complete len:167 (-) Transcript_5957:690-1190(-)
MFRLFELLLSQSKVNFGDGAEIRGGKVAAELSHFCIFSPFPGNIDSRRLLLVGLTIFSFPPISTLSPEDKPLTDILLDFGRLGVTSRILELLNAPPPSDERLPRDFDVDLVILEGEGALTAKDAGSIGCDEFGGCGGKRLAPNNFAGDWQYVGGNGGAPFTYWRVG